MRTDAPRRVDVTGSGLRLAACVWEPAPDRSPPADAPRTLLLLHGYLDAGGTFSAFVRALPPWLRVVAPDLRGHGTSEGVHRGSWYHFHDYARDVRSVVDALGDGPLAVLGHSMGGSIAALFAGAWPDEVVRLVIIEGLGPPREDEADGPVRLARWVRELAAGRPSPPFASMDEVAARLRRGNPRLDDAGAAELAGWLAEPCADGVRWRHDPWHRARSPAVFQPERYAPFLAAVRAPTLFVGGERSWYGWDDLPERMARVRAPRRAVTLPDCGHMIHYEAPSRLAALVEAFLVDPAGPLPGPESATGEAATD